MTPRAIITDTPGRASNATTLTPDYSGLILSPKPLALDEKFAAVEDKPEPPPEKETKIPRPTRPNAKKKSTRPTRTSVKKKPSAVMSKPKAMKCAKRPAAKKKLPASDPRKTKPKAKAKRNPKKRTGQTLKMDYNNIYPRIYGVRARGGSQQEAWSDCFRKNLQLTAPPKHQDLV